MFYIVDIRNKLLSKNVEAIVIGIKKYNRKNNTYFISI